MRASIRELRRRELIEATRDVIAECGFESATIAKISKRAGFSMGYLHHHFDGKDGLLIETIRVLYGDIRDYLALKLPEASDPLDRFLIILDANFREAHYTQANAFAWISFLARVPFNQEFVRLYNVFHRRMQSNLIHDVGKILPEAKAPAAVDEIASLMDGYWVRLGVLPGTISSREALEHIWAVSDRLFDGKLRDRLVDR